MPPLNTFSRKCLTLAISQALVLPVAQANEPIVVNSTSDLENTDSSETTLREAIALANDTVGADTITFDTAVFNGGLANVIRLQHEDGDLNITDAVTINATTVGGVVITGDALGNDKTISGTYITDVEASKFSIDSVTSNGRLDDNSRIFRISNGRDGPVVNLLGLTLTGGRTVGNAGGAAINREVNQYAIAPSLTLTDCVISGNSAGDDGDRSRGGGILSRYVPSYLQIENSIVSGNSASGIGGGVYSQRMIIIDSSVTGNSAGVYAGGVYGQFVKLENSTLNDNSAKAAIGGMRGRQQVTLTNSTVSGNSDGGLPILNNNPFFLGRGHHAGGVSGYTITLVNSTVSGNRIGSMDQGAGVHGFEVSLTNSIVLGNANQNGSDELPTHPSTKLFFYGSNIVGANSTAFNVRNLPINNLQNPENFTNANPRFVFAETFNNNGVLAGVLADNGGRVPTIALNPITANPAIDAGDDSLVQDVISAHDARGGPDFNRLVNVENIDNKGGSIDLGAYEVQANLLEVFEDDCGFFVIPAKNGKLSVACL